MGSRLENKSNAVRKRIEAHSFSGEDGDEYEGSAFGGFSDYFRRKKIKLQNLDADLRARSGDKPAIFRGIVAHINGYTQPSLNDLHELIVSHGGGFIQYLDGKTMVTHIIASNLTPKKAIEFRKYRIVKPAWIVESVNAGRLLPWNDYRVLDEGAGQRVLGFEGGQVVSQANVRSKGYREQTANSWYTSQLEKHAQSSTHAGQSSGSSAPATSSFDSSDLERLDEIAKSAATYPVVKTTTPNRKSVSFAEDVTPVPDKEERTRPASSHTLSPTVDTAPTPQSPPRPDDVPADDHNDVSRKSAALTAEEHNSILLADPRIRKSSVVNPDFLEQYYRESRLHHLSTWKADLKSQLQALTEEKSFSQKAKQKRPAGARRYVMHVDFDSFFVAVSLKKCPQYKDKPCVVAHGSGSSSEIASCNYPARKFGISNGMWMKKALELYKDIEVLPYDFPAYEEASRKFYDAILATGGIVQSVSIDEALIDISTLCIAFGGTDGIRRNEGGASREEVKADEIASQLRKRVLDETGCNVSVGIGANILLAKVALRKAKPAGQYHLRPEEVLDFIGALEVQSLPGVAYSLGGKLEEMGIRYVKDIRECTREMLMSKLGPKTGEKLWDYARGIDRVEVGDVVTRKSVSAEVNWGVRFENQQQVDDFLENLCGELQKRLLKEKVKGRQLTVKIMRRSADAPLDPPKHLGHGKCDTFNKSIQLGVCTNDAAIICKEALSVMRGFGFSPGELRGIGVQMQKLEPINAQHGKIESSQRRLAFKQSVPMQQQPKATTSTDIDEVETPKAVRVHDMATAAIPFGLQVDSPSKRPLNVMGTQFMLPTQVDPAVLAELPHDIRSKLIRSHKAQVMRNENIELLDDSEGKAANDGHSAQPPTFSQLDADAIAALPADVRAEVLSFYGPRPAAQAVLPQSPRKNRVLPAAKPSTTTSRRGRPRTLFDSRPSTLTQSNFITRPTTPDTGSEADTELDPSFLAALPADLRDEVLAQHRAARLRRTGGIEPAPTKKKKRPAPTVSAADRVEKMFRLPPRQRKPTFSREKLASLPDLRAAVGDWVKEFWDEEPFEEDVAVFAGYLSALVESGDMDLAVRVAGWLGWVVEEDSADRWGGDEMRLRWDAVVERVRDAVRTAVRARGLGEVQL